MTAALIIFLFLIYDPHISQSSGPAFLASSIMALYSAAVISTGSATTGIAMGCSLITIGSAFLSLFNVNLIASTAALFLNNTFRF